jgi:hypothetical protein
MAYRISRNFEASIIDFLREKADETGGWDDLGIEKTFARIEEIGLPILVVRLGTSLHEKAQIGDNSTRRTALILIDIFAENDGQRLDIKDWIISNIKNGMPYYEYETSGNQVISKIENGRIQVRTITDEPIDFDVPKSDLDVPDRFRHLITLDVTRGTVEA